MDFADKKFLNLQSDYLRVAPTLAAQPRPVFHTSVESVSGKLRAARPALGASWRRAVLQAAGSLAAFSFVLAGMNNIHHTPAQPDNVTAAHLQAAAPTLATNS